MIVGPVMIYTCHEMIRDCRDGRAEGYRYFVAAYVPVIRKLMAHYQASEAPGAAVERVLLAIRRPESGRFQSLEPAPERHFAAHLPQKVLEQLPPDGSAAIDLETVAAALEPLTLVEKQATWLETMRYLPAETASFLRMAPPTVEEIRYKAADLVRGKVDSWSCTILADTYADSQRWENYVALAKIGCLTKRNNHASGRRCTGASFPSS